MLRVEITSDRVGQFKTTLALLIQEELDKQGIRSEVIVDTPDINFFDNLDGLAAFSEKNPILIKEM